MVVSIIIPTYNRCRLIGLTLESFVKQNLPKDKFEIIVADNNSTDYTKEIVGNFIKDNPGFNIRYFIEKRQGVHYARNSAAKLANGKFLYFTDDDMIADPDLINGLLDVFDLDDKIGCATGVVLPKWEVEPPKWIVELCNNALLSLNNPDYDLIISKNDCNVYSCHQMIIRDVFFKSGGFNPENTMGEWIGDGETGLNLKVKELGYKFAFSSKSVIHHIIPPARLTQKYLNKRLSNQGNSDCYTYYRKFQPSASVIAIEIFKFALKAVYSILKSIFNLIKFNNKWRLNFAFYYYNIARIKYNLRLISNPVLKEFILRTNWIDD